MNCLECRRILLVEPRTRTATLAAHLRSCPVCARLASRQAVFERDLQAALHLPVPENLSDRIRLEAHLRRPRLWRRFAIAAAIATLSASLALGGWEYHASQRLAGAITQQMNASTPSSTQAPRLADPELAQLTTDLGRYLNTAHLGHIVSTDQRMVAGQPAAYLRIVNGDAYARIVMLPHARLTVEHDVQARGLPGKLIPIDDGVIAVFCPDRAMLSRVARDLRDTQRWRG